jgi:hypothetical protein
VRRGQISLGDALRAARALQPDGAAADAMLRMLGLERELARHEAPALGVWKASSTTSVMSAQRQQAAQPPAWRPSTPPPIEPRAEGPARASRLVRTVTADSPAAPPAWVGDSEFLGPEALLPPPSPPPLFGRVQQRGLLSAALATPAAEGDVDVDAAVRTLAELRPLRRLPRRRVPTLRRGVHLLLDIGAGMLPFLQDQQTLVRALDDILADDRLAIRYFAGSPTRGAGSGDRDEWRTWRPPAAGIPVLVVSDLGLGGERFDEDRAGVDEWLSFAAAAGAAGHRPIALVPYEATRWPAALQRAMTLVHWSERTTAAAVRRALRESWGRGW